MDHDFLRAYATYIEIMDPAVKQGASSCVKQVFQQEYWMIVKYLDEANTKVGIYLYFVIAIVFVLILGIIALAIYLRKRKTPEDEEVAELASDASDTKS